MTRKECLAATCGCTSVDVVKVVYLVFRVLNIVIVSKDVSHFVQTENQFDKI